MAGILDRAKSKLFGEKNKNGRRRSKSCVATLPLSGHTFTMRLVRPEMRQLHKERMRQDSDTTSTGSSEVDSDVSSYPTSHCKPARITTERRRCGCCGIDPFHVPTETRAVSSRKQPDSNAVILRQSAPSRCYRVEVSHSVCLDEINELNSDDEDSLVGELDRMQAELGKKEREIESCLKRDSTASGSDVDSGIGGIRHDVSENASCSPHPRNKLEQQSRRKTVRFRFDNYDHCQRDKLDSEEESWYNDDCLSSVSEESSNDGELDTDEEYLGRI